MGISITEFSILKVPNGSRQSDKIYCNMNIEGAVQTLIIINTQILYTDNKLWERYSCFFRQWVWSLKDKIVVLIAKLR